MIATVVLSLAFGVGTTTTSPSSPAAQGESKTEAPPASVAHPPGKRVAGDLDVQLEFIPAGYRSGTSRITTPLPQGYPLPTPPGAIEIKSYPLVRRAQVTRESRTDRGMNGAFWPLFMHIQRRGIEMTSPVEMDFAGMESAEDAPEAWTMSFLYRRVDQGPTGQDGGSVEVVDVQPVTVVAIGFRGPYGLGAVRSNLEALEAWLAEQTEWEQAGEARALYYNGPEARNRDKWGEVQLPIRPKQTDQSEAAQPE